MLKEKITLEQIKIIFVLIIGSMIAGIAGYITSSAAEAIAKSFGYLVTKGSYNSSVFADGLILIAAVPFVGFLLGSLSIAWLNKNYNTKNLLLIAIIMLVICNFITALNGEVLANSNNVSSRGSGVILYIVFLGFASYFMSWVLAIGIGSVYTTFHKEHKKSQHMFLSFAQAGWALSVATISFISATNSIKIMAFNWFILFYVATGLSIVILIISITTKKDLFSDLNIMFTETKKKSKVKKIFQSAKKANIMDFEEELAKIKVIKPEEKIPSDLVVEDTVTENQVTTTSEKNKNNDVKTIGASLIENTKEQDVLKRKVQHFSKATGLKLLLSIVALFSLAFLQVSVSFWWNNWQDASPNLVNIPSMFFYYPTASFFLAAGVMSFFYGLLPNLFIKLKINYVLLFLLSFTLVFYCLFSFGIISNSYNKTGYIYIIIMGMLAGLFYSFSNGKLMVHCLNQVDGKMINKVGLFNSINALSFSLFTLVAYFSVNNININNPATIYVAIALLALCVTALLLFSVINVGQIISKTKKKKAEVNELITF